MIIFTVLGFVGSIFQLVLLREFTFSIAKNELALVLAIGIWLVFSSLGSLVGVHKKLFSLAVYAWVLSALFGLLVGLTHLCKSCMAISYFEMASLPFIFFSAVLIIGSMSFFVGYGFGFLNKTYLQNNPSTSKTFAQFFGYNAAGFFLGGACFTFFLSSYTNPFVFTFFPLLFLPFYKKNFVKKFLAYAVIVAIGIISLFAFQKILEKEFKGATILYHTGSPYGPIILTEQYNAEALYVNGSLVGTTEDIVFHENTIHTALSARKENINVLFIGPASKDEAQEILKHPVRKLTVVYPDKQISEFMLSQTLRTNPGRADLITQDPVTFLRKNLKIYDCIIIKIPPPSTLALNRYYSKEFFNLIFSRLSENGIFAFSIPSKRDILSPAILNFTSCILNTVDLVFPHRLVVPSDTMLVLVSKNPIFAKTIIENFRNSGIATSFLTPFHLKDSLDAQPRLFLEKKINTSILPNQNFVPMGFLYYLLLEQAKFYPNFSIDVPLAQKYIKVLFLALILTLSLLTIFRQSTAIALNAACFGFIAMGLSSTVYVLFQIFYGSLFWKHGILVGLFMAGISLSVFLSSLLSEKIQPSFKKLAGLHCLWILLLFFFLFALTKLPDVFQNELVLYFLSFVVGAFTGLGYPLLTRLLLEKNKKNKKTSVAIYAADLTGAFVGSIGFSIFFIPFLGIAQSFILLITLGVIFGLKNVFR